MPSYLSVHRAATREQLPPLLKRAEALRSQPPAAGITIRNVAVVPRTRCLYIHADAPAAALVSGLLAECGLAPVSIAEASRVKWGRLIRASTTTEDPLEPDEVMGHTPQAASRSIGSGTVPATGFEPVIFTLKG